MIRTVLLLVLLCTLAVPGHAESTRNVDTQNGCKPFRCLYDSDCNGGVCQSGFCAGGTQVHNQPVRRDSLSLGASAIRTTEITQGPRGSYKVEALRRGSPVASLEWSYSVRDGVEEWKISGSRNGQRGNTLTFDTNGRREGGFSDKFFFELSDWLFKGEGVPSPLWLGELGLTSGTDQWQLLSRDDCVSCSFPGCNCS